MSCTRVLTFTLLFVSLIACDGAMQPASTAGSLVQMFKSPSCGCCVVWAEHLEQNGFRVESSDTTDLRSVKQRHSVPSDAEACHTAVVEGYVIEGHVPAADIQRLLRERPEVHGLTVPGMPLGSPGMESRTPVPYVVYAFDEDGTRTVFSRHE